MKQFLKNSLIYSAVVATMIACGKKDDSNSSKKDGEITRIEATKSMESDDLANAGEQLMTPYTWNLADKVFSMALEKNPMNTKAQFYKALLKPMMVYRGILTRVKPFARQYGNIRSLEDTIQKTPKSPLKEFLLDGKEDISSAKQIQDLLVVQREAFNDLRLFLKEHSDVEFTVNLNPYVWEQRISENTREACKVVENGPRDVVVDCNYQDVAITKIGSADIVAATQMVAGYVLFYDLYTSYSVEGLETVFNQLQKPGLTQEQQHKIIESVPTIGKLRSDNKLAHIRELGTDFVAAAKWALKYQDRLCARGLNYEVRPGYALKNGICIENTDEATKNLALLEQGIKGAVDVDLTTKDDNRVHTTLNYAKFLTQPVSDLRALAPSAYCSKTGAPSALRDKTMNGLYPNGDAEKFTLSPCQE